MLNTVGSARSIEIFQNFAYAHTNNSCYKQVIEQQTSARREQAKRNGWRSNEIQTKRQIKLWKNNTTVQSWRVKEVREKVNVMIVSMRRVTHFKYRMHTTNSRKQTIAIGS